MIAKTLLLATDLSCRCDRALDRAVALAEEWGAKLVVLHALQGEVSATGPSWRSTLDPVEIAWRRLRADLQNIEKIQVELVLEQGDPVETILNVAQRFGCELVVTGVARDETFGRRLLGSTVEKLVRKSPVPVLVVKGRPHGPYQQVVVATDFSEGSDHALATTLTLLPKVKVRLLHAYDVNFDSFMDNAALAREPVAEEAKGRCEIAIREIAAAVGRDVETICENGDIEDLLQDLIQARGIDLVALGTHGRSGLMEMLLGSVAQRLLASLPTDVLVVRPPANS